MANTAKRTLSGMTVTATWNGGAYIDLAWAHSGTVFEVINVYDYNAGAVKPEMAERGAVSRELSAWLKETGTVELRNYWQHIR